MSKKITTTNKTNTKTDVSTSMMNLIEKRRTRRHERTRAPENKTETKEIN